MSSADKPHKISVFDDDGGELQIPREAWIKRVLPDNLQQNWDRPEELALIIRSSLIEGFAAEVLEAARQLHRIDPEPQRGAMFLAATLLQLKRYAEAEQVLRQALTQGEDGVLLTNLAKAYWGLGEEALAKRTLWHALEVDPNQDNGLVWLMGIERERGGRRAEHEALARLAALPTSWRPQLWLARSALEQNNVAAALELYREALSRVEPAPEDLLMQISGDLGNHRLFAQAIAICVPRFKPDVHGIVVGKNLMKAYCDLGQALQARAVLEQLFAHERPGWRKHLVQWEYELIELEQMRERPH